MTNLIPARCKDEALQREIQQALNTDGTDSFDIWWLGQSGFLLQWNRMCVLFDPYLSDSLTKKYATTNKPHVRMSERVIDPRLLNSVDIVTSSHNHTDHLDAETLGPLLEVNPGITFIIPEANRHFVHERTGCKEDFPIGLADGMSTTLKGFTFHGIPAAHNEIERDEKGRCKFLGYVVQFGKFAVYHSGDTLWHETLDTLLKPFQVDVAFLPINGNEPARGVAGNLNAAEAAQLGKAVSARFVIPHHYNMFTFNTADPQHFIMEADKIGQKYIVPALGEKITIA